MHENIVPSRGFVRSGDLHKKTGARLRNILKPDEWLAFVTDIVNAVGTYYVTFLVFKKFYYRGSTFVFVLHDVGKRDFVTIFTQENETYCSIRCR